MRLLLLLVSVLVLSCSGAKTVMTERNVLNYHAVLDSIKSSGTTVGPFRTWSFITDENRMDKVLIGTLYKNGESTGSIQIREVDSLFNVKIIDVLKK